MTLILSRYPLIDCPTRIDRPKMNQSFHVHNKGKKQPRAKYPANKLAAELKITIEVVYYRASVMFDGAKWSELTMEEIEQVRQHLMTHKVRRPAKRLVGR
jgi:hypothetical protein